MSTFSRNNEISEELIKTNVSIDVIEHGCTRGRGGGGKANTLTLNLCIFLYVNKVMHPLL